jgi:hypothetical protein
MQLSLSGRPELTTLPAFGYMILSNEQVVGTLDRSHSLGVLFLLFRNTVYHSYVAGQVWIKWVAL